MLFLHIFQGKMLEKQEEKPNDEQNIHTEGFELTLNQHHSRIIRYVIRTTKMMYWTKKREKKQTQTDPNQST